MAKRYYWLKLKDDFFTQKEIKRLRKIAGGDTYTIIYLKLLLLSLKNEGKIYFDGVGDNFVDELALELDEEEENVQITLNYLMNKGLLESVSEEEIYLNNVASMIGSETDVARRVRKHRKAGNSTIPDQSMLQSNVSALQGNIEVTPEKHLGNREIEIDIEIEKRDREKRVEAEKDKRAAAAVSDPYNIYQVYQENFGMLSPFVSDSLMNWESDLGAELVTEAMRRAALEQKGFRYAEGIMKQWAKKNILTMEQVTADDVAFENRKKQPLRAAVKQERLPGWASEPRQEEEALDEENQRKINERIAKLKSTKGQDTLGGQANGITEDFL